MPIVDNKSKATDKILSPKLTPIFSKLMKRQTMKMERPGPLKGEF
jgi:hypothetical protein